MKMTWSILLAFAAGAAIAVQFAVNSELRGAVGSTLLAAGISFLVGTVVLFAGVLVTRGVPPAFVSAAAGAPWRVWAGGLLGAFFVFASVVLTPRLGAASTIAFIIAGQMVASIILDQFGLLNGPVQPASFVRLGGAALVMSGAYLVLRF